MVKPSSKAVEELVSSVRSNVDVVRDAMKSPATNESHAVVQDMMLDLKESQEKLQKKASELAESGQFDNTNVIFEAIDQVSHLEPDFGSWSKSIHQNNEDHPVEQIGANIHMDPPVADSGEDRKTKKKKKKKRKDDSGAEEIVVASSAVPVQPITSGWEAFPPPPQVVNEWPVAPDAKRSSSSCARITLGMPWDVIGPLLGDPGSSHEERKARLAELIKEAISNECQIAPQRIRISRIS